MEKSITKLTYRPAKKYSLPPVIHGAKVIPS